MRIPMLFAALALTLNYSAAALAHVTVWPRESKTGAHEKYTVRVPTEGKVATTSVELQIPEGVSVVSIAAGEGSTYEMKKSGERTTAIVWTRRIEPGEFAEFAFIAKNPAAAAKLEWKATQRFVDGSTTMWMGAEGDARPASVTLIAPAPAAAPGAMAVPPAAPGGHAH